MKKSEKVIATIAIIIGYLIIAGAIQASGGGGAITGLMLLGIIYGIRSIWKSKKEDDDINPPQRL